MAAKKKATKKKAAKKVTKKAAKKEAPKKVRKIRSTTASPKSPRDMSSTVTFAQGMQGATLAMADTKPGAWRATQAAEEFRRRLIHTGLVEVDINLRLAMGARLQIIGAEHAGKSLLCYLIAGAYQRTCRQCLTPMILWHNDLGDGEKILKCGCGANDPCTVLYIDVEGDFDPLWAAKWGFKISENMDINDPEGDLEEVEEGLRISPDAKVALARIISLDQVEALINHLVKNGAADLIILDSLALTTTDEELSGKKQQAPKGRILSRLYPKLISAQNEAWIHSAAAPTFIQTNGWRANIIQGGGFGPTQIPAGGKALRYALMQDIEVRSRYNPWDGANREPVAMSEMNISVKKDKASGGSTNAQAQAKLFLKDHTFDRVPYSAGESDEGSRLLELARGLAEGAFGQPKDERWFKQTSKGYETLGRTFKRVSDLKAFFGRPDIGYLMRFPLFVASLPDTFRAHIDADNYLTSPFKDTEPLTEMILEARERVRGK